MSCGIGLVGDLLDTNIVNLESLGPGPSSVGRHLPLHIHRGGGPQGIADKVSHPPERPWEKSQMVVVRDQGAS